MDLTAAFASLARGGEGEVRLGEAALWIAADEYPDLDVAAWLRQLDALGGAAADAVTPGMDVDKAAAAINRLLFEREGFRGNREDYYDPRNSFLNDVLERRQGIPITLSVVYIEVAVRAGIQARGVGLPGHFIVELTRHGAARRLDPFNAGAVVDEAACRAHVQQMHGADARFDPAWLRPVTTRQIVTRMLVNLKGIYTTRGDWRRALRVVDRLVTLVPDALDQIRDRGAIRARLGLAREAIADWEAYLAGAAGAPDAEQVRGNLRALRQAVAVLN